MCFGSSPYTHLHKLLVCDPSQIRQAPSQSSAVRGSCRQLRLLRSRVPSRPLQLRLQVRDGAVLLIDGLRDELAGVSHTTRSEGRAASTHGPAGRLPSMAAAL